MIFNQQINCSNTARTGSFFAILSKVGQITILKIGFAQQSDKPITHLNKVT